LQDAQNIVTSAIGQNLAGQGIENRAAQGCNGNGDSFVTECYPLSGAQYQNSKWFMGGGTAMIERGRWVKIEIYMQLNTIASGRSNADGIIRYWYNGALRFEHSNVLFRTAQYPSMQFNQFMLAPYIGVGSPVNQSIWIDNLVVGSARP
jgi:hypothetical protein